MTRTRLLHPSCPASLPPLSTCRSLLPSGSTGGGGDLCIGICDATPLPHTRAAPARCPRIRTPSPHPHLLPGIGPHRQAPPGCRRTMPCPPPSSLPLPPMPRRPPDADPHPHPRVADFLSVLLASVWVGPLPQPGRKIWEKRAGERRLSLEGQTAFTRKELHARVRSRLPISEGGRFDDCAALQPETIVAEEGREGYAFSEEGSFVAGSELSHKMVTRPRVGI